MGDGPRDAKHRGLLELDDPAELDLGPDESSAPSGAQRPTLVPKFDPARYAEESEIRERMPTLTDEAALEHARLQSVPSVVPPRRPMPMEPEPLTVIGPESSAEIDSADSDIEALDPADQAAILADRLAPLSRVPTLARQVSELGAMLEDPKTAYVLGFIDGILPLETIIEVTGLPELDTLRVLDRMASQGILMFKAGRR